MGRPMSGAHRPAHRLSEAQRHIRAELIVREALVRTRTRYISVIRALVRRDGLRVRSGGSETFVDRLAEVDLPESLSFEIAPLIALMEPLRDQIHVCDARVREHAKEDEVVRRLCTAPGIGPVTAATFVATLDTAERFERAHQVEAYLGLVPREMSSGERQHRGRITFSLPGHDGHVLGRRSRLPRSLLAAGLLLAWCPGAYAAEPVRIAPGPGGSPLPVNRDIFWSEPPDLNGVLASSEQISQFGLRTEIANDFIVDLERTIILARWWGGYWQYTPGDPHVTSFVLRFFESDGCLPGALLQEVFIPDNAHETVITTSGDGPLCEYSYPIQFHALAGQTYWFVAQAGDHPFPPQWGRLQSTASVGCDAAFRSVYWGYPDWVYACLEYMLIPCDFSQEFEDDPGPTPVLPTTWGRIRSLYR